MEIKPYQDIFLNPESVAVVGATERPGAWGAFIMGGASLPELSGHDLSRKPAGRAGLRH